MTPARASVAASVALAFAAGCADGAVARVLSPDGDTRLEVCLAGEARTADERMAGLRDRPPLSGDEGLLIVFPLEGEVCLVNDGVGYAIDAVYADDGGTVVAVEHDIPAGDATARCHDATRRVLEVRGGVAAEAAVGDRLVVE